jgi:predicted DNA-binding transcriptional regulator YafY
LLKQGLHSAAALASELEVSESYIEKLVATIRASGIKVYTQKGKGGGYTIKDHRIMISPDLWKDAKKFGIED